MHGGVGVLTVKGSLALPSTVPAALASGVHGLGGVQRRQARNRLCAVYMGDVVIAKEIRVGERTIKRHATTKR